MARLLDLAPEVRTNIYKCLLVKPVQEGLRISFNLDPLDSRKTTRCRSRCIEACEPHEDGHSAHPCRLDASRATLHHLDFTDSMSLARTNRTLYAEASRTIYNNADLTLSFHYLPPTPLNPAFSLLTSYLWEHCSSTRAMLLSLVIHDESANMSPGDAKRFVDLVDFQLPNLKAFGYYITASTTGSLPVLLRSFCTSHQRAIRTIQPFVGLKAGIRTTMDITISTKLTSVDPQLYTSLCQLRKYFAERALPTIVELRRFRRLVHDHHELALDRGRYLHVTQTLRSLPDTSVQFKRDIPGFEEVLAHMHTFGINKSSHREMLRVVCTSL